MKTNPVAKWMNANLLTSFSLATAIKYSPGAVAKWRQGRSFPSDRAENTIRRAGERRGWSPFPSRAAV